MSYDGLRDAVVSVPLARLEETTRDYMFIYTHIHIRISRRLKGFSKKGIQAAGRFLNQAGQRLGLSYMSTSCVEGQADVV